MFGEFYGDCFSSSVVEEHVNDQSWDVAVGQGCGSHGGLKRGESVTTYFTAGAYAEVALAGFIVLYSGVAL